MTTRMLIDARHREETRVAVIKGNRIEEFDFESAEHKQLKGNIYLAKVTRVEPSLQAAFIEYGGNRHGFLAFSEIHPDYYQIPKEDREALLKEEAEHAAAEAAMRAEEDLESIDGDIDEMQPPPAIGDDHDDDDHDGDHHDDEDDQLGNFIDGGEQGGFVGPREDDDGSSDGEESNGEGGESRDGERGNGDRGGRDRSRGRRRGRSGERGNGDRGNGDRGERGNGDRGNGDRGANRGRERSDRDEAVDFRRSLHRRYKIQDVIRRRQVLLVQVVKEERGTKGAALTTYLSLAGRYCVLMPNSSHGGGISRKISNGADRKRLKSVIDDLNLPTSMGCIVRTAGLERTKTEIKRDFDYLARLWDEIREKTLGSAAPALIHSDSDLIKRAIRDIYNSGIEDVFVEGDDGYRAAKDFMKLLMPSHARKVKQYSDPVSLFQRYGVEDQLGAMYQPVVPLKSGGYLVINPTEALVSIDINSGRSTREHNIEQTAYNTNLEAAYEIARQLRLRDMAGLVVIDFIDMEVGGNVRRVERAMRDALKNDRARIQVGRISGFGLMEMSRQRLRTGVLEASTRACPHCEGTGLVRTASSAGLSALRLLEEEAARGRGSKLVLRASQEAALYVLNNKRAEITEIEQRYGVIIEVQSDGQEEGARMTVEASGPPPENRPSYAPIVDIDEDEDDIVEIAEDEDEEDERPARREGGERERSEGDDGEGGERSSRRRGRRRRGRRDGTEGGERGNGDRVSGDRGNGDRSESSETVASDGESDDRGESQDGSDAPREGESEGARRRRRGRRGGRNRRPGSEGGESAAPQDGGTEDSGNDGGEDTATEALTVAEDSPAAEKPKRRRRSKADAAPEEAVVEETVVAVSEGASAKPKRSRAKKADAVVEAPAETVADAEADAAPAKPKRASRAKKADAVASVAAAPASSDMSEQADAPSSEVGGEDDGEGGDRKRGWWQRTFGA
jgi:ribonuclease E